MLLGYTVARACGSPRNLIYLFLLVGPGDDTALNLQCAHVQCSHASLGLAQDHLNHHYKEGYHARVRSSHAHLCVVFVSGEAAPKQDERFHPLQ